MRKQILFAAAALALAAVACQKNPSEAPVTEPVMRTFTCTFETPAPDSKVAISDLGKSTWEVGDEILIHGSKMGTSGSDVYSTIVRVGDPGTALSADNKKVTFSIPTISSPHSQPADYHSNLYIEYPASAVSDYSNGSTRYYSSFKKTNLPLMAGCNNDTVNDGNSFTLYNCCGIISFTVSGDFDSYSFSGNGGEVVGYTTYLVRIQDGNSSSDKRNFNNGSTGPLTTITEDVVCDGTTVNYICLPNGTDFSGGFTIQFLKGGSIKKIVTTSKAVNVARGKLLPLGNVTGNLKDYVAPVKHDNGIGVTVGTATDLGATSAGTANCYVVSSTGNYKFKAVKGNSSALVGTVASVSILWETWNNAEAVTANSVIAAADYDQQDGEDPYIVFKMPGTLHAGNALIAAKNTGGDILWSWHIWVPETSYSTDTYGLTATAMMSRNLGALVDASASDAEVDVRSFGLLYQWGRKDPFMGAGVVGSNTGATMNATLAYARPEGQLTIAQSIANPTTFGYYSGDWVTPSDNDLWGDVSETKTIYDPCPPGYKVPRRDETANVLFKTADLTTVTGWEANATYHWFTVGSPKAVFPICGYLYYNGKYDHVADRALIWNSHISSDTAAYTQFYNAGATSKDAYKKAYGGSVRCVAE